MIKTAFPALKPYVALISALALVLVCALTIESQPRDLATVPDTYSPDDSDPFAAVDTEGENAVTVQVLRHGAPLAKLQILEGQMGRVASEATGETIGFVPEEISLRGDSVRVAIYSVQHHLEAHQSRTWVEDLTLPRGETVALGRTGEREGARGFQLRLLGSTLVTR